LQEVQESEGRHTHVKPLVARHKVCSRLNISLKIRLL
jgi:hypothetical protein